MNSPIALCRLMNLLSEQAARDVICENTLTTRANWSFNDNGAPFPPGTSYNRAALSEKYREDHGGKELIAEC